MPSGGSYFERTFYILLPLDIGKVERERCLAIIELFASVYYGGSQVARSVEELYHLGYVFNTIYIKVVNNRCFACVLFG